MAYCLITNTTGVANRKNAGGECGHSERKTMNGSTEAETAHRPAWGGVVGGSVSVPTPSGSKDRRDAAVAAPFGERDPRSGTRDSVPGVSRALDRFESRTWKPQRACRPQPRPTLSIHAPIRCDAREASRQNARRACACATRHPRAPRCAQPSSSSFERGKIPRCLPPRDPL